MATRPKILAMVAALLVLSACGPSKSEKMPAFRQKCGATEFTHSQCELLAELYAASIDAKDAAVDAGIMAGAGVGIATAGAGSRR
jgi:hypothetical protein